MSLALAKSRDTHFSTLTFKSIPSTKESQPNIYTIIIIIPISPISYLTELDINNIIDLDITTDAFNDFDNIIEPILDQVIIA
jgi:hypothetical protein